MTFRHVGHKRRQTRIGAIRTASVEFSWTLRDVAASFTQGPFACTSRIHERSPAHVLAFRRRDGRATSADAALRHVSEQHLVLIVDDRAENRELCRECLSFAGFQIIEARDGAEAVRLAGERRPDVIVMDVAMPVMNGYEACRLMKNDPRTKTIPIILLTATPAGTQSDHADEDALLIKPCTPDDLENEVRKWIEVRRARARDGRGDT